MRILHSIHKRREDRWIRLSSPSTSNGRDNSNMDSNNQDSRWAINIVSLVMNKNLSINKEYTSATCLKMPHLQNFLQMSSYICIRDSKLSKTIMKTCSQTRKLSSINIRILSIRGCLQRKTGRNWQKGSERTEKRGMLCTRNNKTKDNYSDS